MIFLDTIGVKWMRAPIMSVDVSQRLTIVSYIVFDFPPDLDIQTLLLNTSDISHKAWINQVGSDHKAFSLLTNLSSIRRYYMFH